MTLSPAARALIAEHVAEAPPAGRRTAVDALAERYGVSRSTVYRIARLGGSPRGRAPHRPEYRPWVSAAVAWSHRAPKPIPLDLAIAGAIEAGELPAEAARMPLATARRLRRELDLAERPTRTHRLHAEFPMQAVQLDASTSEYLVAAGADEGDATRLALYRKPGPASGYKNKPLGEDRLRVVVYALWDLCTGAVRSRYCVARGENALDTIDFLCWALAPGADPRVVVHGVPEDLWVDQGPLLKSAPARDLIERLDVNLVTGAPYAKERMGGVERSHRTRWARFERPLFLRSEPSIALGELNARLQEYEVRENGVRSARTPVDRRVLSRTSAWLALTQRRPADRPLRRLPDDPLGTLAREARRVIDVNGLIRWDGALYESTDWHARTVIVRRRMDGSGDLVVEDPATGARRTARRYAPRAYGEVRAAQPAPLDRLLAGDAERERPGADVYAPQASPAVVPMPPRTAPAAPLENPLAAGHCRDLAEAWRAFADVYPHPLAPAQRARLERHFLAAELDRGEVMAIAQELAAAAAQEALG